MSQDDGWRVAISANDWVTVKTAEDAVKLGKAFATLVADLGVYKAERERYSIETEVLRKKVEWLQKADRLVIWNGTEWQVRHQLDGETRVAK